jgi:hypothetical protein
MRDHAAGIVGEILHVAALDLHPLAIANIGYPGFKGLLRGSDGREQTETKRNAEND